MPSICAYSLAACLLPAWHGTPPTQGSPTSRVHSATGMAMGARATPQAPPPYRRVPPGSNARAGDQGPSRPSVCVPHLEVDVREASLIEHPTDGRYPIISFLARLESHVHYRLGIRWNAHLDGLAAADEPDRSPVMVNCVRNRCCLDCIFEGVVSEPVHAEVGLDSLWNEPVNELAAQAVAGCPRDASRCPARSRPRCCAPGRRRPG